MDKTKDETGTFLTEFKWVAVLVGSVMVCVLILGYGVTLYSMATANSSAELDEITAMLKSAGECGKEKLLAFHDREFNGEAATPTVKKIREIKKECSGQSKNRAR